MSIKNETGCAEFGNQDASMAEGFPDCTQCATETKKLCIKVTHEKIAKSITEETAELDVLDLEQRSGFNNNLGL